MEYYKGMENGAAKRKKDPINEEFGRRLKEVFKKHGMSLRSVCEATGLSKTLMNFWANGYKTIRISAFAQIADKVSLTTSEIVYLLEPYWEDEDDG